MRTEPGKNGGYSVSGVASMTGLATLALVVGFVSASYVRANDDERDLVSLVVPAAPSSPDWDDKRRTFAGRLQRGYGIDREDALDFAGWILEASVRQDFEPELLASVVMAESNFRKEARSIMGAVGPAQIRPDLWRQVCGGDLYDPEQNLYCAAEILSRYREACAVAEQTGLTLAQECALRAYNVGFRNRNNVYFLGAAVRYLEKIDRFREPLRRT